jgi:HEAT repeat protein
MSESFRDPPADGPADRPATDIATIRNLVDMLGRDDVSRQHARQELVEIGAPAVPLLLPALESHQYRVRWEAAKTLGQIGDERAAPALVTTLEDRRGDIRWLAARGLIAIGRPAVRPLLEALISRSDSSPLRQGARHVLKTLAVGRLEAPLAPVLQALEGAAPAVAVIRAAEEALEKLQ